MTLAYDRVGSGPPLVLLHGVGHRRQAWTAVTNLLRNRRELIMVDLPGHGESPPLELNGREPVQAMAEDVIAFFDELGLDRPHVAGNSLGGALALIAGSEGRAATVTGLSPAGFWVNRRQFSYAKAIFKVMEVMEVTGVAIQRPAPWLARYRAGRAFMFASVVSRPSRLSPEQAATDARAFLTARVAVNAIVNTPLWFTAAIPAELPVTIAWGTKDRLLLPSQAAVAQRQLPHARHLALPGCGHVPMTDDPALVAQVLLDGSTIPATPAPAEQPVDRPADQAAERLAPARSGHGRRAIETPDDAEAGAGLRGEVEHPLPGPGEAQLAGHRFAGPVQLVVHDLHPVDARQVERRADQGRGRRGGQAAPDVVPVHPVADLQATRTDPGHQAAAARDDPVHRDRVVERQARVPVPVASGDELDRVLPRVTLGPRHPRAQVVLRLDDRHVGGFLVAEPPAP